MSVQYEDQNRSLRILYSFPHSLGSPGVGNTAWHQVRELVRKGHRVTLVSGGLAQPVRELYRCITTLAVAGRRIPRRLVGRSRSLSWHDLVTARLLRDRPTEFDVVHVWPLAAGRTLLTARNAGVPGLREAPNTHTGHAYSVVAQEMSSLGMTLPRDNPHRYDARRLATEEREWHDAAAILVPSETVAKTFAAGGFDDSKLLRHRYGYDPELFGPRMGERPSGGLRAVFVGRCEPRKGLHHALAAWHRSAARSTGTFTICGAFAPGYAERLSALLDHPSIRVLGFTDDPAGILASSDVLMLPSIEEGSALVVYEALASGCVPLVSTAAGAHVTAGVDAFLHEAGDIQQLTEDLDALATDPQLLRAMRGSALQTARDLTWSSGVDLMLDAYRVAIARGDARTLGVRSTGSSE